MERIAQTYQAGDPMDRQVRYFFLSSAQIAERINEQIEGADVSSYTVKKLLAHHGYGRRLHRHYQTYKSVSWRNEQFERIDRMRALYLEQGLPTLSIDVKKKERLGRISRPGPVYSQEMIACYDHDFDHYAEGLIIPHGIYDLGRNDAYLTLGLSRDTARFNVNNLRYYWEHELRQHYPQADRLLLFCDTGGCYNVSTYLFKHDLAQLARDIGLSIRVCHYPPYCSKYNPIEHRFFCHLTHQWSGMVFDDLERVCQVAEHTTTKAGLTTKCRIDERTYRKNSHIDPQWKKEVRQFVSFDEERPLYNYVLNA